MLRYSEHKRRRKVAQIFALFLAVVLSPVAILRPIVAQTAAKGARAGTSGPASIENSGWALKFAEEFDGAALNYTKWSPHAPGTLGLGGVQTWIPEAIEVSGGEAHIVARASRTGYTSGIITTFGTFAQTYGRFEIRFRMPAGRGLEPLFRLLPVPLQETPSIDVMNAIGSEPTRALFANRWGDARTDRDYSGSYQVANLSTGFHTASVEWDADQIVWTVDGVERFHSFDGVPHQPMFLEVSLAVGTERAGAPDDQTRFPAVLDIDYVRVFARR